MGKDGDGRGNGNGFAQSTNKTTTMQVNNKQSSPEMAPKSTEKATEPITIAKFDDLGLKEDLLRGIYSYGYENPSEIQQKAIIPILQGRDVIAQAQSGTGKTAAFSISALQQTVTSDKFCQTIVLSPTRELATQSALVAEQLSTHMKDIRIHACIGGTSKRESAEELRRGCHIVVGTPGRITDMIRSNLLKATGVKLLIIDEADEMLSLGFLDQMREVIGLLPQNTQIALFSATLPPEALEVTSNFMRDPLRILVNKEELTLRGLKQYFIALSDSSQKFATVTDVYGAMSVGQTVIFCNTRREADDLANYMTEQDFTVSVLHSALSHDERTATMAAFRTGSSRVLIASNVIARGIDVQQVSLVINFSMCPDVSTYIHRVGRSARFGRKGIAINLITPRDVSLIRSIETYYATQIDELPAFEKLHELM